MTRSLFPFRWTSHPGASLVQLNGWLFGCNRGETMDLNRSRKIPFPPDGKLQEK